MWAAYWTGLPPNPTADRHAKATVATLTSFYARAFSQRQVLRSFEDFYNAAQTGKLKCHSKDWLPPSLLADALERIDACGQWRVHKRSGRYELICTMADGTTLTGTFQVRSGRFTRESVTVAIKRPAQND